MIELVVFDMAGTTVLDGDAVNASFRGALAAAGIEVAPAAVNAVMGLSKPEAIRILLKQCVIDASDEPVHRIHDDFVDRMRAYYQGDPAVMEIPGAGEVFGRLRASGIGVALNTGFSRPIVDALLARLGWQVPQTIDAVVASDEVAKGRPHPDMIQLLMARFRIADARRIAKVGDTPADLQEGANAGCGLIVGVLTGSFSRDALASYPHTHIVDSIRDLAPLLSLRYERITSGRVRACGS